MQYRALHGLDRRTAKTMVEETLHRLVPRYQRHAPEITWRDTRTAVARATVGGVRLEATLRLQEGALEIDVPLPWSFHLFEPVIRRGLDAEIKRTLETLHQRSVALHDW